MTRADLIRHRLRNQKLFRTNLTMPAAVVSWLGAVQAQDYSGAKWALALRAKPLTDEDVDRAFNDGAILRTHVLRPTWHFVAPADIRWILTLSAPRVHAVNAYYYRQQELDPPTLTRARGVVERALEGGKALTREELASSLERARIPASGMRLAYVVMHNELERVICSGPRRGKQFTYMLLEERVAPAPVLTREETLAALASRYFASHGPATVRDYVWWSGLTVRDAKAGIALAKPTLERETIDDLTVWFVPSRVPAARPSPAIDLLPNYDEYGIAYKDRAVIAGVPRPRGRTDADEYPHLLTVDGQFVGRWRRTLSSRSVLLAVEPYRPLTKDEDRALSAESARFGRFLDLPATLSKM